MTIRPAKPDDREAVWRILREVINSGDAYALDPGTSRERGLAYWFAPDALVYVLENDGGVVGTYMIRPNQPDLGSHVANAGFMVAPAAQGKGVGRMLAGHCLKQAQHLGYRAMQFNFVVSTNRPAIHLWQSLGFVILATIPQAFRHRAKGFVDVHIMFKQLRENA